MHLESLTIVLPCERCDKQHNGHLLIFTLRSDRDAKELKEKFLKGKSPNLVSYTSISSIPQVIRVT